MKYYRFPENKLVTLCFPVILLALQIVARSTMYSSTIIGFITDFNNIIISDGAARLGNEGDTTLVGALYIITKWEEGVRA